MADAAQWIESVGTAGAFVTATALLARELYRSHRADERRQAERVAIWPVEDTEPSAFTSVIVLNAGDLPIYDVAAVIQSGGRPDTQIGLGSRRAMAPGEQVIWPIPPGNDNLDPSHIVVKFSDAGPRAWQRNARGSLNRYDHRRLGFRVRKALRWLWPSTRRADKPPLS